MNETLGSRETKLQPQFLLLAVGDGDQFHIFAGQIVFYIYLTAFFAGDQVSTKVGRG
jgi:hypothetical protein